MKISTKNLLKAGPIALAMGIGSYTVYASEHIQVNNVAAGAASFDTQGAHTTIHAANNTIINYGRFDIPQAHSVQFVQPGADARVLNRVQSMNPSVINGTLTGNGTVYLVNPAGIIFGPGSVINTHRFHAAAGNITNDHFLAGTERYVTEGGALVNNGTIHTNAGAHLIGSFVENHGAIYAPNGIVTLTAGDEVFLQQDGSSLMLRVDNVNANTGEVAVTTDAPANDTGVENHGRVEANEVFFAVGDVYSLALENRGEVVAKESATLTGAGRVTTTGEIQAGDGSTGGDIALHGQQTIVAGDLNASGSEQGGSVTVTGASIDQSAAIKANSDTGKGGEVTLHATGDVMATSGGTLDANGADGGSVTIAADGRLITSGQINAIGHTGEGGDIALVGRATTSLLGAPIDASGATHGGSIHLGRADHALVNAPALKTVISPGSTLTADATGHGDSGGGTSGGGGTIVVWSDGNTHFHANASAIGSTANSGGGFIEVSAAGTLNLYEEANLDTAGGTILLDPKNIIITDTPPGGLSMAKLAFGSVVQTETSGITTFELSDGDDFGSGVAMNHAGDLLAVGASSDATGGANRGAIYLFSIDPSGLSAPLTLGQKLAHGSPLDGGGTLGLNNGDFFGSGVALNSPGDRLAVGAPLDDTGGAERGAAYLFSIDPADLSAPLSLSQKLADGSLLNGGGRLGLTNTTFFGTSVAFNSVGDRLAVGAARDDTGGNNRGAAYLFSVDPADLSAPLSLGQKLAHGSTLVGGGSLGLIDRDFFGTGVAFNGIGDRLAVGASRDDAGGGDRGAVYLFSLDPADLSAPLTLGQKLAHGSTLGGNGSLALNDSDFFGFSVALNSAGDRLAVGTTGDDTGGRSPGAVYLFSVDPSDLSTPLTLGQKLAHGTPLDTGGTLSLNETDFFGTAVAFNGLGDRLAVGAREDDTGGLDRGAAYLFSLDPTDLTAPLALGQKLADGSALGSSINLQLSDNDKFGSSIALNNNGDILVVGASEDTTGGFRPRGAVYVFGVDPANPLAPLTLGQKLIHGSPLAGGSSLEITDSFANFGSAAAMNGDGGILAIGAERNTNGGGLYLFTLDTEDITAPLTFHQKIENGSPLLGGGTLGLDRSNAQFGSAAALNGDGDILVVGAQKNNDLTAIRGAAYLFALDTSNLAAPPSLGQKLADGSVLASGGTLSMGNAEFGSAIAMNGAGDLVAIGAESLGPGRTFIFTLDPSDLTAPLTLTQNIGSNSPLSGGSTLGLSSEDFFGSSIAMNTAGDLLAVGAQGDDTSTSNSGAIYLFSLDPLNPSAPLTLNQKLANGSQVNGDTLSLNAGGQFGSSAAFNSTGSLLAVGAYLDDTGGFTRGAVYLFDLASGGLIGDPTAGFADNPGADSYLTPTQITNLLGGGSLTIQANNDIHVQDMIDATAGGLGDLSLFAGRSILIDADLLLNGSFEAIANTPASFGVVDTHRDPGDAVITMAPGTTIDTTAAPGSFVDLIIENGLGLTNNGSGAITTQDIRASRSIVLDNFAGGDVVADGDLSTTEPNDAITIRGNNVSIAGDVAGQSLGIQQTGLLTVGPGVVINTIDGLFQTTNAPVRLDGDILTESGRVVLTGPVTLGQDVLIDTTSNNTPGGTLDVFNSVDGLAGTESLTVRIGIARATFTAPIGSTQPLSQLLIDSAQDVVHQGNINVGQYSINHTGELSFWDITATNGLSQTGPGAVTLGATLLTEGGAVSFAGPVTLAPSVQAQIDTTHNGAAGAPVSFGSDLEASSGTERLDIFAGTGDVSFRDIGATVMPNSIELGINSANDVTFDGNVFVRELAVNNAGQLTVTGTGNNALGIFSENGFDQTGPGAVRLDADVSAITGDIRFTGPVTVGQDIEVSTGQGDITYQNTVDSLTGNENITTGTGLGNIFFDSPVGATSPLALLNINGTDDLTFNANVFANQLTVSNDGTFTINPGVDIITTNGLTQTGFGDVRLDGDILTESGSVTFGGFVTVGADALIDTTHNSAGGAGIIFQSSLDTINALQNLTLRAGTGDLDFQQPIGAVQPLGNLTIDSANNVTFDASVTVGQLDINQSGLLEFAQFETVRATDGFSQTGPGTVHLNGSIDTTGGDVLFTGPLTIGSFTNIDTRNGISGGSVTFLSTLDSGSSEQRLSLQTGIGGDVLFEQAIGATNPLQSLDVFGGTVTVNGDVFATELVSMSSAGTPAITLTINADIQAFGFEQNSLGRLGLNGNILTEGGGVEFNGPVLVGQDVVIDTTNGAIDGNITMGSAASLNAATGSETLTFRSGTGNLAFDSTLGSTTPLRNLNIDSANNVTVDNNITVGRMSVNNTGTFSTSPGVVIEATNGFSQTGAGPIQLNSTILTEGGEVTIAEPLSIFDSALIDTTHNGAAGADVSLLSTLDAVNASDLTVRAGAGNVDFGLAVGGNNPLGQILIDSANNVTFASTVDAQQLSVNNTGLFTADGSIGATNGLSQTGPGGVLLNVDLITDSGDVLFTGPVTVGNSILIDTANGGATGGGSFTTLGTLDAATGNEVLTILSIENDARFEQAVGSVQPFQRLRVEGNNIDLLSDISVSEFDLINTGLASFAPGSTIRATSGLNQSGAGGVDLSADILTESGGVAFTGPVTIGQSVLIDTTHNGAAGGPVALSNTLDALTGNESLTVRAGAGSVAFVQAVGESQPVSQLNVDSADDVVFGNSIFADGGITVRADGSIFVNGDLTTQGGAVVLNSDRDAVDGGSILISEASINTSGGDIILGGGGDPLTQPATGFDAPPIAGIDIQYAILNAGGGNISIVGQGDTFASGSTGVHIGPGSDITTISNGTISISGRGTGSSSNSNTGVHIDAFGDGQSPSAPITIATEDGDLSIIGVNDTGSIARGVLVNGIGGGTLITTSNGTITLDGDAASALAGPTTSVGVRLFINSNVAATGSGSIQLIGRTEDGLGIDLVESTLGDPTTNNITLTADTMNFSGEVVTLQGTGDLVFQPLNTNTSIGLGDSQPGALSLDDTELGFIADGFAGIRFGRTDGAHVLNIGELTFFDPIVFSGPAAGGAIFVNGDLTGLGDASLTFNGTGTTTTLAGDIRTVSNQVTFNDRVVLARDTTIDTTNQGTSPGASVRFASGGGLPASAGEVFNLPGPGDTPGAMRSLTLITGNGDVTFDNQIGQPAPLTLASLTIQGNNVTIRDRVFVNQMAINNAGVFSTTPDADIQATTGLTQTGNGPVQLNSDIGTSGGDVSFAGPVTIDQNVLVDTTQNGSPGAAVTGLNSFDAVDGNEVLTLRTGSGDVVFNGPVGAQQPFGQIIIDGADDVTAGEVKTGVFTQTRGTGDTTVTDLTTNDGTFDVTTAGDININAGQATQGDNGLNTSSIAQAAADTSGDDDEDAEGDEEATDAQRAAAAELAQMLGLEANQAVDPVVAFELMRRIKGFRAERIASFTQTLAEAGEAGLLQDAQQVSGWLESLPADSPFRADLREVSGIVGLVENLDLPPDAALAAGRVLVRQFVESDAAAEQLVLVLQTDDRFRLATTTP